MATFYRTDYACLSELAPARVRGASASVLRRRASGACARLRRGRLARLMPELRDLTRVADSIPLASVRQLIALLGQLEDALHARAARRRRPA